MCCNRVFIGQTGTNIEARFKEHCESQFEF